MNEGKFYITTAIDYVNAPPHIGHALEKVQADVLARYHRTRHDDVFFLTGADEHGVKIVRAAGAAGKAPSVFVDEMVGKFHALQSALNLSFNDFIRTTDEVRHWPGVRLMWQRLVEAGDIYKRLYKGLYCVGHEAFVTQKDLAWGKCVDHGTAPEVVEEENYFFRLSKYGKEIKSQIANGKLQIIPKARKNEILSFIDQGLEDVSFSRPRKDLSWGITVPGDESQTIYVWCDALTNYLSAIGYGQTRNVDMPTRSSSLERSRARSKFRRWWPADVQLIGKDILRFHAAIWPGMLLSAGLPLPKTLLVHGFITIEGQKMSKTLGNIVDPFALVKKYSSTSSPQAGTDAVRYYLLREIPSGEDGDFSEEKFRERYNGDLANGLGNFAARVLTLALRDGTSDVPNINDVGLRTSDVQTLDREIEEKIRQTRKTVSKKIEEFRLHESLATIWELIAFGDRYVNEKKPWEESQSANSKSQIVFNLVVILDNVAAMLAPFLPETAEKITKSIVWKGDNLRVKKLEPLFPRLN